MKTRTLDEAAARPSAVRFTRSTTAAANPTPRLFGLPTASALVVGSVIGTGVFALPSALASFGPISLVAVGLVTVGALALALTFRALTGRLPLSGGPYVYARDAFGDFAWFLNAWSYWITAWVGNADPYLEVDLVNESNDRRIAGIEMKAAGSVNLHDFKGLTFLRDKLNDRFTLGVVLYTGTQALPFGDRALPYSVSAIWSGT